MLLSRSGSAPRLFLLALLLFGGIASEPRVPPLLADWPAKWPGKQERFWDQADLRRLRAVSQPEAWRPLLEKLRSGSAITVVALGSSITENFGGCFHSSVARLERLISHLPHSVKRNQAKRNCPAHLRTKFLGHFLDVVNATWPHADHVLVNLGAGAQTLHSFLEYGCLQGSLPSTVDLLIFEQYQPRPNASGRHGADVEALYLHVLRLLQPSPVPVPLVLLNFFQVWLDRAETAACFAKHAEGCALVPECSTRAWLDSPARSSLLEEELDVMAAYYGWSTFSLRSYIASSLRDGVHTRLNMTECAFLASLFSDAIHLAEGGTRLVADALVQHLVDVQAHVDASRRGTGIRLPAEVLISGTDAERPIQTCTAPESFVAASSREWAYAAHEIAPDGQTIDKPGWIATGPAATLELVLGLREGQPACVTVVYLSSYAPDMGVAQFDCAGWCTCELFELDSHAESHTSLHLYHHVDVSPAQRAEAGNCTLNMRIKRVEGKGHKFKVLGLATGTAGLSCNALPLKTNHVFDL